MTALVLQATNVSFDPKHLLFVYKRKKVVFLYLQALAKVILYYNMFCLLFETNLFFFNWSLNGVVYFQASVSMFLFFLVYSGYNKELKSWWKYCSKTFHLYRLYIKRGRNSYCAECFRCLWNDYYNNHCRCTSLLCNLVICTVNWSITKARRAHWRCIQLLLQPQI